MNGYLYYNSTCAQLTETLKLDENTAIGFMSWCETSYQNNFLAEMKELCPKKVKLANRRRKRFVFELAISGLVMLGVTNFGFSTFNHARIQDLRSRLSTLESKETEYTAVFKKIEKDLLDMQFRINSNSKRLDALENRVYPTIFASTSYYTNLVRVRTQIMSIRDKWKRGYIAEDLFRLFNVSLDTSYPVDLMRAITCLHDEDEKVFLIRFSAKKTNSNFIFARADPFIYYTIRDNKICTRMYDGPSLIAIQRGTNDICPIESETNLISADLIKSE